MLRIKRLSKQLILVSIMWLSILMIPGIASAGWVSPTGFVDIAGDWAGEPNAYDGNTATYAQNRWRVGTGGFLVLTLPAPINCSRIRVSADYMATHIEWVDIDVEKNGIWTDVWQGAIIDSAWDEKIFTVGSVTKARFRYKYKTNGGSFWLYEFAFYEEPPVINPPTCVTLDASSVEETRAVLQGQITNDGGKPCQSRFQYGPTEAYGSNTGWEGSRVTGDTFTKQVTGLTVGTTYHFRAQGSNTAGIGSGADFTFHTGAPTAGWVSPSGHNDPNNEWEDEVSAYDDNTATYAKCYHNMGSPTWGPYLYLSRGTITSNKIRFWAKKDSNIDYVNIDVFKGGAWTSVGTFTFADKQWIEGTFTTGIVTRARIRFSVRTTGVGLYWELYEFDFYKISLNAPVLSWTGETNYSSDGLNPETGYSNTDFVYRVEYTDADGDAPSWLKVWVDKNGDGDYTDPGEEVNLYTVTSGNSTKRDGNYTNGEWFEASTNIPYGTNTNNCSYYFGASDGSHTATGIPTGVINAPDISPGLITSLSPLSGTVGCEVTIKGTGCTKGSPVSIGFGSAKTIAITTASSQGTFSCIFSVNTQPAGTKTITVTQGYSQPTTLFVITPKIILLSPFSGIPGIVVTLAGNGFAGSKTVQIDFGITNSITTTSTDNNGTFSTTFTVDIQSPGTKTITVTDESGNWATTVFIVQTLLSLSISTSTFTFGIQSFDTWTEATQTTVITNAGNVNEDFTGQLGTFTAGVNKWMISNTSNGTDTCMVQWGTSSTGPYYYIGTYNTIWIPKIGVNIPPKGTVTLYFNLKTPTESLSGAEYNSILTVIAEQSP